MWGIFLSCGGFHKVIVLKNENSSKVSVFRFPCFCFRKTEQRKKERKKERKGRMERTFVSQLSMEHSLTCVFRVCFYNVRYDTWVLTSSYQISLFVTEFHTFSRHSTISDTL